MPQAALDASAKQRNTAQRIFGRLTFSSTIILPGTDSYPLARIEVSGRSSRRLLTWGARQTEGSGT
ncbi:hypothetical protein [Streptomyces flaveus]|uniref:Uncharacterized protein n=1 Tax=Streptomyces flaveus TaxID=66370 RepID=A0A917VMJ5_9ACTN|nr:hypothetical protein [Streptomyces flaveus]GGK96088.1 hypothetical protein GCM10010094_66190 [Streptomyces flaveus]